MTDHSPGSPFQTAAALAFGFGAAAAISWLLGAGVWRAEKPSRAEAEEAQTAEYAQFLETAPEPVRTGLMQVTDPSDAEALRVARAVPDLVPLDAGFDRWVHDVMRDLERADGDSEIEALNGMNDLAGDPGTTLEGLETVLAQAWSKGGADADRLADFTERMVRNPVLRGQVVEPLLERAAARPFAEKSDPRSALRMTALYFSLVGDVGRRRAFLKEAIAANRNPRYLAYLRAVDPAPH